SCSLNNLLCNDDLQIIQELGRRLDARKKRWLLWVEYGVSGRLSFAGLPIRHPAAPTPISFPLRTCSDCRCDPRHSWARDLGTARVCCHLCRVVYEPLSSTPYGADHAPTSSRH